MDEAPLALRSSSVSQKTFSLHTTCKATVSFVPSSGMMVGDSVPGSKLIFTGEHTDPRTYKVSFNRILTELKDYFKPKWNLDMGGKELVDFFDRVNFTEKDFRGKKTIRLQQLILLKEGNYIDDFLRVRKI